jgi:hypothetical protein
MPILLQQIGMGIGTRYVQNSRKIGAGLYCGKKKLNF